MNRMFGRCVLCAVAASAAGTVLAKENTQTWGDEKYRPKLFKRFGDIVNVPDGLTKDPQGNIYHSAPNLVKPEYPGVIVKRDFRSGRWSVLCAGLRSPKTGFGRPMGLEFCEEDGNLYYCDNQYFDSKDYASRVMRVVLDKKGEVLRIETAVDNVKLANAIRFYNGAMFITDTYFDLDRPNGVGLGGVYRIPLADCRDKPVKLLPKPQYKNDPYFLGNTETVALPGRGGDNSGADGLCIDRDGNLFFGTFGSGRFYTMKRTGEATWAKPQLIFEDPKVFPCCDGITYDPVHHRVIMTDSATNAVHTWDIAKGQFATLWRNGDTDGSDGLLDQPCEPLIWKCPKTGARKLIIVNFDMAFPGLINTVNDPVHTLSVIDLD